MFLFFSEIKKNIKKNSILLNCVVLLAQFPVKATNRETSSQPELSNTSSNSPPIRAKFKIDIHLSTFYY